MSVSASRTDVTVRFRAMACDVTLRVVEPGPGSDDALARAQDVFGRVERACTRFDPDSPLMRANAAPRSWVTAPDECFAAVREAHRAHIETEGRFDPRVLKTLVAYGYDRSLHFSSGPVAVEPGQGRPSRARGAWRPGLDAARSAVRIGGDPIDLGGIGKGLAVRWASAELANAGSGFLVEAGGDCYAGGLAPDDGGWRVGVEDPAGGATPLAVLDTTDAGVATSSIRIRRWQSGGRTVHHLIDPRTGEAADSGLLAVTVRAADPAWAEVWSKALFLAGRGSLRTLADAHDLQALWVDEDGFVGVSSALRPHLLWQRDR